MMIENVMIADSLFADTVNGGNHLKTGNLQKFQIRDIGHCHFGVDGNVLQINGMSPDAANVFSIELHLIRGAIHGKQECVAAIYIMMIWTTNVEIPEIPKVDDETCCLETKQQKKQLQINLLVS